MKEPMTLGEEVLNKVKALQVMKHEVGLAQKWKDVVGVWVASRDIRAVREKLVMIKCREVSLEYTRRFMRMPAIVAEVERQIGVNGYDKTSMEADLINDIKGRVELKDGQRNSIEVLAKMRGYMKDQNVTIDMSQGVQILQGNGKK